MSKYTDKVEEIFKHTQGEMFMGGKLQQVKHITDNIIFIESERRMDINMLIMLRSHLDGHIVCGGWNQDVLVIECGDDI